MQSILGALLTAGYAASIASQSAAAPQSAEISASVEGQLQKSFDGAEAIAAQYPQYSAQIIQGAKEVFLKGDAWAYSAGTVAILLGTALVYFYFPRGADENRLLEQDAREDQEADARGSEAIA